MLRRKIIMLLCVLTLFTMPLTALANGEEQTIRLGVPLQGWVSGDGHAHTTYSDGRNTIAEMVAAARQAGLNYLIITDHNNSDAWESGVLHALESSTLITTIWGQEYTKHSEGHATIMSMQPIRNYKFSGDMSSLMPLKDMISEVHSMGGLVIAAHPYDPSLPMRLVGWQDLPWDAIEVWNGYYGGRHESTTKASQTWDRINRQNLDNTDPEKAKQRVYGVAQSDMHSSEYFGRTTYTKAYVNSLSAQNIFNAYRKGNMYGTNGPSLTFTINGQMMGGDVVLDPDDFELINTDSPWVAARSPEEQVATAKVTVRIAGSYEKGLRRAILIHNKNRPGFDGFTGSDGQISYSYSTQFQLNGATSFEREFSVEVAPGDFLRLELEGNDGNTLASANQETTGFAFSNPIFIAASSRTQQELSQLIGDASALRTSSAASYAFTGLAFTGLDRAINDAGTVLGRMGGASTDRPGPSEINSAYNLLLKAIDDFRLLPKVPKQVGWYMEGNNVYYVQSNMSLATGFQTINANRYYFSEQTGAAMQHWYKLPNGDYYFFDYQRGLGERGMAYQGFHVINNKTYYFNPSPDNRMVVGLAKIDGYYHYFNSSGNMQTGWMKAENEEKWYYFHPDTGRSTIGWLTLGGQDYYLMPNTALTAIGMQVIDGQRYVFNEKGQRVKSGWYDMNGTHYYINNGVCATGWMKIGGRWYIFSNDAKMLTGWQRDGDKWYYLNGSGAMQTGWLEEKTTTGSKWYYLNSGGDMAIGWVKVGSQWYYMRSSGVMETGWQKINSTWYYLRASGAMHTGWYQEGSKWYYLQASGAMATGTLRIGNRSYTFNSSGVWVK